MNALARCLWISCLVVTLNLIMPGCGNKKEEDDSAKKPSAEAEFDQVAMAGTWRVVKIEEGSGKKPPPEIIKELRFVIAGNKMTPRRGQRSQPPATFTLDPSKKPKAIDLIGYGQERGPDGKLRQNTKPVLGIYDIQGRTLRLCLASDHQLPRPTNFTADAKNKNSLLILEKAEE